jgi:hypothetical protein
MRTDERIGARGLVAWCEEAGQAEARVETHFCQDNHEYVMAYGRPDLAAQRKDLRFISFTTKKEPNSYRLPAIFSIA